MFKNRSIRLKFFISYLVFLIPTIVLFVFLNNSFIKSLEDEIQSGNLMQLRQLSNQVEQEIKALSRISDRISVDNVLSHFNMNSNEYATLKGINELKKYKAGNTLINDLFICYGGDEVFSSQGRNDFDVYAKAVKGLDAASCSILKRALYEEKLSGLSVLSTSQQTGGSAPAYLLYYCPIPTRSTLHAQTVGFLIEIEKLEYLMDITLRDYNGFTNMVFDSGTVAAEVNNTGNDSSELLKYTGRRHGNAEEFNFQGVPYIFMSVYSEGLGCHFNIAIETRQIYNSLTQVRKAGIIVFIILLAMSVLIAGRLTVTNYRPIKKLRDAVRIGEIPADTAKNELIAIQNAISYTVGKNESLSRKLMEYRPILLQQTNTLLFSGILKDEEFIARMIKLNGIQFYNDFYCVCSVFVAQAGQTDVISLLDRFNELCEFLCCDISYSTQVEDGYMLAIMLNVIDEDKTRLIRLKLGEEMLKAIGESGYENSKIGFGKVYGNMAMVSQSYMEAIVALEGCAAPALCETVMFFEEMARLDTRTFWFAREDQAEFINALRQRDIDKITCSFSKITTTVSNMHLTQDMLRFMCYNIIHIVFDTLLEMELNQVFIPHLLALSFRSLDDFTDEMRALFNAVCLTKEEEQPGNKKLRDDLLNYIHKNYKDSDLALESIAKEFNISKYYLSRFFKENTGEKYIDYLSNLRIQEAKRLLKEENLPVKDVIQQVGYFDVASFNKKFKRAVGISAREYRELCHLHTNGRA